MANGRKSAKFKSTVVLELLRGESETVEKDVCKGMALKLRSDHGSQYGSNDFMAGMKFLGLNMSKAFVTWPKCNGCIERFHRTLEEEVFSLNHFKHWTRPMRPSASAADVPIHREAD
ncbi:hypothetical protein [Proteiniphilum sp. X52]|uniref:hypothetical protein n=1 Tax=Proteiniphilum sp. X52 TaxID=2382159 RepID=UPI000F0A2764|nr:hypothetical protein [Proteiniphilum sp. X52]RNC66056.1 hypothetical protein D7D25_03685 [Proteiniphilum sp. X52]